MDNKQFLNQAARQGAVLGGLLGLSLLFEIGVVMSGSMGLMTLMMFEWLAVVVLHYALLHRYTKRYRLTFSAEEGFPFGRGYGFLMTVSAFAGVVVGMVQVVGLHLIIGYPNYIDHTVISMQKVLAQGGGVPASMETVLAQSFEQIQNAPIPSVLSTFWSGMSNVLLFGIFFGLIIAGVLAKAPKLFDNPADEE